MDTLLVWLGGTPAHYWFWAIFTGSLLIAAAFATRRVQPWVFVCLLVTCLFACRWPIAVMNRELGVDESQMVASAMKLAQYPIAWKHADLNTSGPLNAYPLSVLSWIGLPINYLVARLFALATIAVALASGYLLLREELEERIARCAVLPAAAFFSLTTFHDFVHYTSEHVSLALLGFGAASLWIAARRGSVPWVFAGTAALGAVPWAKLQGAPIALWFALAGGGLVAWQWRSDRPLRWRLLGAWLAGGCAVTVLFAVMLVLWGLVSQWWVACVQQVFMYMDMSSDPLAVTLRRVESSLWHAGLFETFFHAISFAGLVLASAFAFGARRHVVLIVYLAGGLLAAIYAIGASGRVFFHYLLYFVMPATLLVGALLDAVLAAPDPNGQPRSRWFAGSVLAVFLAITVLTQIRARASHTHEGIPYRVGSIRLHQGDAARFLASKANPDDTLSMWGWVPRLHVESRLVHATRDSQTERQIVDSRLRDFYRSRYLSDLRRYRPRFFVEAVGPQFFAFTDRLTQGVASWPELQTYVTENYELIEELEGFRIFEARTTRSLTEIP